MRKVLLTNAIVAIAILAAIITLSFSLSLQDFRGLFIHVFLLYAYTLQAITNAIIAYARRPHSKPYLSGLAPLALLFLYFLLFEITASFL